MHTEQWLETVLARPLIERDGFLDGSGVPDRSTELTFKSFGYEWTQFDVIQPEDEKFFANYTKDVNLDSLSGRIGLDAGAGKGRFSKFLAPHLRGLVVLDGSESVHSAVRNLSDNANVVVIKADLRADIFHAESFDFISCLGVLHHLDDPEAGFRHLVSLLTPNGTMLLYVYSRPAGNGVRAVGLQSATTLRRITTRLPHGILRVLSAPLCALLFAAFVLPGVIGERMGSPRLQALPLATYRRKPLRSLWLDTFDRLSAPIENRYSWGELNGWFERAAMKVEGARDEAGWFVVLRKSH